MKHIKPASLGLLKKTYRHLGRKQLVLSALGFFELGADNPRFLGDAAQWQKLMNVLPFGVALDEVMPKVRSEVLLSGSAYSPLGRPIQELTVSLTVGTLRKHLRVFGDRSWANSLLPVYQVSEPLPFTEMPLTYTRSFGGPKHSGNPQGCGYTGNALSALFGQNHGMLPNLEYPHQTIASPAQAYAPANFGPIALNWSPRKEKFGTYNQHWIEHDAPGLAADIDLLAFNRAPADQWLEQPLIGGEAYALENLHPQHALIQGLLPAFIARGFIQRKGADNEGALEEVTMLLDTVWFFPSQNIGLLIYHGQTEILDAEAQDISAVMVAYEHPQEPKTLAHYRDVYALRSNAETAALHVHNETQLAPTPSLEVLAQRRASKQAEAQARRARLQAITQEMQRDLCTKTGLPLPDAAVSVSAEANDDVDHNVADAARLGSAEIEAGDFDLTATVAAAKAKAAQARAAGEQRLADMQSRKAASPDELGPASETTVSIAEQKNSAFELASVPAYDLLPGDQQPAAIAPAVDAMVANLKLPTPQDPQLIASLREKFAQALLQMPALRRKGRHAASTPSAPAQAMAPSVAAWLGLQVQQWLQGGAHLAGRDLAGVDLRHVDFSGADLRQTMLERADLSGAKFINANLDSAVLTGAILDGADFSGAGLQRANLCGSSALGTCFAGADLSQARANDAVWRGCDLTGSRLGELLAKGIDLRQANLDDAELDGAQLLHAMASHSSWRRAHLNKTNLMKAELAHADFSAAHLLRVTLLDAVLPHSVWRQAILHKVVGGGKSDWAYADLRGMRAEQCGWHGASFVGADWTDALCLQSNLDDCDFSAAQLCRALFSGSRLMNAKLCNANAERADFYQASARKADFSRANLRQASLVHMDLSGAVLTDAILAEAVLDPNRSAA